jgi:uncharacterized membrane-anchored protein
MKLTQIVFFILSLLFVQLSHATDQELSAEEEQYLNHIASLWSAIEKQQGKVTLPNNIATLIVPDNFYYLSPADAEKLLVDIWGNVPGSGQDGFGVLFPVDISPLADESWAVTIDYEEDGYVSDEDADDIDYDELLSIMKKDTEESSQYRIQQGYEAIKLVGWASAPYYDKAEHKLHWAKELKFGDNELNTLNYNIRVLGRKGVLVLNFIAGMNQKELIDSQLNTVLAMAEFNEGSRYEDFDPDIDTIAAYGLGTLVAGKVIAKTGMLAAALIFLKKFGVIILVGIGALFGKLFKRKQDSV